MASNGLDLLKAGSRPNMPGIFQGNVLDLSRVEWKCFGFQSRIMRN